MEVMINGVVVVVAVGVVTHIDHIVWHKVVNMSFILPFNFIMVVVVWVVVGVVLFIVILLLFDCGLRILIGELLLAECHLLLFLFNFICHDATHIDLHTIHKSLKGMC